MNKKERQLTCFQQRHSDPDAGQPLTVSAQEIHFRQFTIKHRVFLYILCGHQTCNNHNIKKRKWERKKDEKRNQIIIIQGFSGL